MHLFAAQKVCCEMKINILPELESPSLVFAALPEAVAQTTQDLSVDIFCRWGNVHADSVQVIMLCCQCFFAATRPHFFGGRRACSLAALGRCRCLLAPSAADHKQCTWTGTRLRYCRETRALVRMVFGFPTVDVLISRLKHQNLARWKEDLLGPP